MKFLVRKNILKSRLDFNMEFLDRKAILRPRLDFNTCMEFLI